MTPSGHPPELAVTTVKVIDTASNKALFDAARDRIARQSTAARAIIESAYDAMDSVILADTAGDGHKRTPGRASQDLH